MIFSVKENTITAYGRIWDGNGMEFVSLFAQMEKQYSDIIVKLHTYGGSVFDGNLIYNTIQNSKKNIDIQIIGIAASMGAIISQSRKIKPRMVRNGYLMIHAPSGSTDGTATDHENTVKLLRSIEKTFKTLLVASTGKPENYVSKWMQGDNWFDAEQALQEGLISEILEPESETLTASLNPKELGVQGMYYQFTALLNPKNEIKTKSDTMKKPIIEALALTGVNEQSSDTAVIEAVNAKFAAEKSELQGKLDAEIKKRETLEASLKEKDTAAITAELERAKKELRITAAQVPTYQAVAEASGLEVLKTVLAAIPARQTITGQFQGQGSGGNTPVGRDAWTFDQWQTEDPKGLELLAQEDTEKFTQLFNAKYNK